jgi:tetratricopeptide (TPR) repeat protein
MTPEGLADQLQRGAALYGSGDFEAASASFRLALRLAPESPEAHFGLGVSLLRVGRHAEALASLGLARTLRPAWADPLLEQARCLKAMGRLQEAVAAVAAALVRRPDHAPSHMTMGSCLAALRQPHEARQAFEAALRLDPSCAPGHYNRGCVLEMLHLYDDALASHEQALRLDSGNVDAMVHCAHCLLALDRLPEAVEWCERATRVRPDDSMARWNLGLLLLALGDFARGLPLYELRHRQGAGGRPAYPRESLWLGQIPLQGQSILLHAEQGYGDTMQFCRYATLLAERGARVQLEVPKRLETLMGSLAGVESVLVQGDGHARCELHCPLPSLPLAVGTDLQAIPARTPYLSPDHDAASRWGRRLGPSRSLRVGLAWSGNAANRDDQNRSLPLRELAPLGVAGVELVSLQKDVRSTDAADVGRVCAWHFGDEHVDFAETAALISQVDLVISVDTAVAHLAGALGKAVWILLPLVADWRWLLHRRDSPWYPSATLFRQSRGGRWDDVIQAMAADLRRLVQERCTDRSPG